MMTNDERLKSKLRAIPAPVVPRELEQQIVNALPRRRRTIFVIPNWQTALQALGTIGAAALIMINLTSVDVHDGARSLASALQQARQQAMTFRHHVAVLLPNNELPLAKDNRRYNGTAYRLCVVDSHGRFVRYLRNSTWQFLPKGLTLRDIANTATCEDVHFPNDSGADTVAMRAIIFRPNGTLTRSDMGVLEVAEVDKHDAQPTIKSKAVLSVGWITGRIAIQ